MCIISKKILKRRTGILDLRSMSLGHDEVEVKILPTHIKKIIESY